MVLVTSLCIHSALFAGIYLCSSVDLYLVDAQCNTIFLPLFRALRFVSDNPSWPLYKALYEGACLSFLTEIDPSAHVTITNAVISKLIGKENFR